MDFGSLLIVVGTGATIDVLADINLKKEPIVAILGAALLLIILGAIGRVTGEWEFVTIVAVLYLLASFMNNYKNVPAIASALNKKGQNNG